MFITVKLSSVQDGDKYRECKKLKRRLKYFNNEAHRMFLLYFNKQIIAHFVTKIRPLIFSIYFNYSLPNTVAVRLIAGHNTTHVSQPTALNHANIITKHVSLTDGQDMLRRCATGMSWILSDSLTAFSNLL